VGAAYSLDRLNKARKSHSVPFKSCLRWQYSSVTGLGRISAADQKIEILNAVAVIELDGILLPKQVIPRVISASN
jgi:hypothetical protein